MIQTVSKLHPLTTALPCLSPGTLSFGSSSSAIFFKVNFSKVLCCLREAYYFFNNAEGKLDKNSYYRAEKVI